MEEESELQPLVVACPVANEEGESEDEYEEGESEDEYEEEEGGGGSESESESDYEEEEKEEEASRLNRKRKRPSDAIVPVDELPAPVQKSRIWSVNNEITLLECMHKEGFERNSDELYEIIQNRLEWDVQRNQLTDKIYRLRKKYFKIKNQVLDGEEPADTTMEFYRLADKVWGEQHKADEKVKGKAKFVRKKNVEEEEEEETDDDTKTKKTKFMSKKVMMERSEKHVESLYEDWERVTKVYDRMRNKYLK